MLFGFNDAAKWAVELIASAGGTEVLKQQVTGWFGIGYDDEVIMIRLIDALNGVKPAWCHGIIVQFIAELTPHQKTRLRHVLGTMLVPPPTKTKEMVTVLGPDGQPLQEKGKYVLKEKITETSVEYTDKDPRVMFLQHLAKTIGEKPTAASTAAGVQVLLVTGAILEKAVIERVTAFGKSVAGKLVDSKDAIRDALFAHYGVNSYPELTLRLEADNAAASRELEIRKDQFWMEWLVSSKSPIYTLFVVIGTLTGLGLVISFFMTAPK